MQNVIIFPWLKLMSEPKTYQDGTVTELQALPPQGETERFHSTFKLIFAGKLAKEFPKRFRTGQVIRVKATAECYKAKVYGKLGKPIKYPNGKFRYTTKVRFRILRIKHGAGFNI